jgi:ketosteroid isomerase-like protein
LSRENVDAVKAAYAAYNSSPSGEELRELVARFCVPDVQWRPLQETRPYRGHDGVVKAISGWFDAMEDVRITPQELMDDGDQVLVEVHITGRGRSSGVQTEARTFHVFEMRGGQVARFHEYASRVEAQEAMGGRGR